MTQYHHVYTSHIRYRWLMHSVFWVGILMIYVVFFGRTNSNYLQTFVFVGMLMPITVGTTYFLNYFLVPHYFMRGRYGLFALYCMYSILGSLCLEMFVALFIYMGMARMQWHAINPASVDIFFLLASLLMVVFFGVALKVLLQWQQATEDNQRLRHEKLEAELKFLKIQLNPHFLFNTLNNLYYLASEKSDKAPQAILALSEILDYVLKESKSAFIIVEKEWEQAKNYIALEMLRYSDRVQVNTSLHGSVHHKLICPMLLITLLENSFKHGVMQVSDKSWIVLEVDCQEEWIDIRIGNSCKNIIMAKGIGLENIQSQLHYLYGATYRFSIDNNKQNEFWVHIQLPAKQEINIVRQKNMAVEP